MSLVDIVARLRLNAQTFGTDLQRELQRGERQFAATGSVLGRNLSTGINAGLQDATSRIPVLGGALSGLSGPALGAAAAVGGIAAALTAGVRSAESLQAEIRRLDGVLSATGNHTGFDRSEIVEFAEEMERAWAISAEEIIRTQAVLATFDNVSGPVFQRTIRAAADLSATFNRDLADSAQTLGRVLQNLGNGDVEGLSRGLRDLGVENIDVVRTLAEAGRTAEAQERLFAILEARIGGTANRRGEGLSGAMFRLVDAGEDVARNFSTQSGLYGGLTRGIEGMASAVDQLADRLERLGPGGSAAEGMAMLMALATGGPAGGGLYNRLSGYLRGENTFWTGERIDQGRSAPLRGRDAQIAQLQAIAEERRRERDAVPRYNNAQWSMMHNRWVSTFPGLPLRENPEWTRLNTAFREAAQAVRGLREVAQREQAAPRVTAGRGGDGADRTNQQVWEQFRAALSRRGIEQAAGRTGFRTAADQNEIYRTQPGATPLDGYRAVSRHQTWQALDPTRASARGRESEAYAAAQEVGLRDFRIVRESGGRFHYQWRGHGRAGDLSAAADESDRNAEQQATEAARAAERRRDAERESLQLRERILRTGRDSVSQDAERLQTAMLRARGLEREAAIEEGLNANRRTYDQQMAQWPERSRDALNAQASITPALTEQLAIFEQQVGAYTQLIGQFGEGEKRTEEQQAALVAAHDAMRQSLTTARGLGTTLADQREIADAIVRAEVARTSATEEGTRAAAHRAEIDRKNREAEEEAQRHLMELQEEAREREREQLSQLADYWETLFTDGVDGVWDTFKRQGMRAIAELAAQWTLSMLSGQRPDFGLFTNSLAGGQFGPIGSLLGGLINAGGKGAAGAATGLGGAAGAAGAGGGLLGGLGGVGGALGSAMPYVGAALAAFSLIQGLGVFNSTKRGSATLGFSDGQLGAGATRGNSREFIAQTSGAMKGVATSLQRIADTLGGEVTGAGSVSLGMRDGKWRGDPTGRGITKTKKGAINFGDDEEAAVRWAISEALRDGVIGGITDASKRILQAGGDLEKAIEKATMIEGIPDLLKARLDPLGFALDQHVEKWDKIIAALNEGGASAEQMADAQKLYNLELEDVKNNTPGASASLKAFLDGLKVGPSSPYSLRQQEEAAKLALQPFLDKIGAGEGIDQEKYQDAAKTFLDIERQLYGSTGAFFTAMDTVMAATTKAIEKIDTAAPIRTVADPFIERTAQNTDSIAYNSSQASQTLARIAELLEGGSGNSGGGGFAGGGGGFYNNVAMA